MPKRLSLWNQARHPLYALSFLFPGLLIFEAGGHEQDGGGHCLIGSSGGADVLKKGLNGWTVLFGDLTFFDQVTENEFERTEVVAVVDGDEVATEGDFDQFQERDGFECGIGLNNEESQFLVDAGNLDGLAWSGGGKGVLDEFEDGLRAVRVDAFELLEGAFRKGQRDGAAGFVEFRWAPAQVSMRHGV